MSDGNNHGNSTIPVILLCIIVTIVGFFFLLSHPELVSRLAAQLSDTAKTIESKEPERSNELTQEIADMQVQIEELQHQVVEAQTTIDQQEREIKSDVSRMDGMKATITSLELRNKALSEQLASLPDFQKKYEKEKEGLHFSLGVSAGSPLYSFRPEATASVGIGRGNWQVITGVGYSADGPKLSLGFQWTF